MITPNVKHAYTILREHQRRKVDITIALFQAKFTILEYYVCISYEYVCMYKTYVRL